MSLTDILKELRVRVLYMFTGHAPYTWFARNLRERVQRLVSDAKANL